MCVRGVYKLEIGIFFFVGANEEGVRGLATVNETKVLSKSLRGVVCICSRRLN